jgi:branched-chain amino acid transport system permease protein
VLYFIEQCLNGMQLGMLLFLLAAGLTLIFGIMDLVNLAHGSLYMLGAYFAATFAEATGSFVLGAILALRCMGATISITCSAPLASSSSSTTWCG